MASHTARKMAKHVKAVRRPARRHAGKRIPCSESGSEGKSLIPKGNPLFNNIGKSLILKGTPLLYMEIPSRQPGTQAARQPGSRATGRPGDRPTSQALMMARQPHAAASAYGHALEAQFLSFSGPETGKRKRVTRKYEGKLTKS